MGELAEQAMRTMLLAILAVLVVPTGPATAEIRDILTSAEIDAMFARTHGEPSASTHLTPGGRLV